MVTITSHSPLVKIIAYCSLIPYLLTAIFTFRSFNSNNIIHILNIQLILSTLLNTITYLLFYDSSDSMGCTIQCLIGFCSTFTTSFIVMFISYLNIKLFTNNEQYESNLKKIYFVNIFICWIFPIILTYVIFRRGIIKEDDFNYCFFEDNFSMIFCMVSVVITFLINLFFI